MATEQATLEGQRRPPRYVIPWDKDDYVREDLEERNAYGIMHASDYEWDNVECTKRAYGDQARSLMYHSEWMDPDEAAACVKALRGEYTYTFKASETARVVRELDDVRVVVGREHSPVVYVWTETPRRDAERFDRLDYPPEYGTEGFPRAETFPKLTTGERKYKLESGTPTLLRAWWD